MRSKEVQYSLSIVCQIKFCLETIILWKEADFKADFISCYSTSSLLTLYQGNVTLVNSGVNFQPLKGGNPKISVLIDDKGNIFSVDIYGGLYQWSNNSNDVTDL